MRDDLSSDHRPLGRCPRCGKGGPTGEVCPGASHRGRTSHFVPLEYLARAGDTPDPLIGRRLHDRLIVAKLGEGGAGAVYLALQGELLLPVAVKMLIATADTVHGFGTRRFKTEARALARLRHPNIVRLYAFEVFQGRPYMVMEYVEGAETLRRAMRREVFDLAAARWVLTQLVDAMEAVHAAGLAHRDIKPSNIMIQPLPRDPWFVRVVDFGLAKMLDRSAITEHAAGTLAYMAPEQLTTGRIGPWSDWYAVGLIAARLLVGRHPFLHGEGRPLVERRLDPRIDPVEALGVAVPPATAAFLRAALAWHPKDRLSDAEAFRAAMGPACDALAGGLDDAPTTVRSVRDLEAGRPRSPGPPARPASGPLPGPPSGPPLGSIGPASTAPLAGGGPGSAVSTAPVRLVGGRGEPASTGRLMTAMHGLEPPSSPGGPVSDLPSAFRPPMVGLGGAQPSGGPGAAPRRVSPLRIGVVTVAVLLGAGLGLWLFDRGPATPAVEVGDAVERAPEAPPTSAPPPAPAPMPAAAPSVQTIGHVEEGPQGLDAIEAAPIIRPAGGAADAIEAERPRDGAAAAEAPGVESARARRARRGLKRKARRPASAPDSAPGSAAPTNPAAPADSATPAGSVTPADPPPSPPAPAPKPPAEELMERL